MTVSTEGRTTLTVCPSWCYEPKDWHGDLHESSPSRIDLPGVLDALWVGLAEDATAPGRRPPTVTAHNGDSLLLSVSPASARSLAAALVHAANIAEGLA